MKTSNSWQAESMKGRLLSSHILTALSCWYSLHADSHLIIIDSFCSIKQSIYLSMGEGRSSRTYWSMVDIELNQFLEASSSQKAKLRSANVPIETNC